MHLSEMHVCFQSLQICWETSFLGTASQLTGKDRVRQDSTVWWVREWPRNRNGREAKCPCQTVCAREWINVCETMTTWSSGGRFRINKRNLVQMIWNFWDAVCFVSSNRNFLGDLRLNLLSGRAEQERAWALLRTYLMLSRLKGRYYNFHIRYIFIFIVRL